MFEVLSDARATMDSVIKPTKDPLLFVGPGRLALAKLEVVRSANLTPLIV